ncbi:hypothetical protein CPS_2588 [Colwellia psychrerythraea 34H]|uniref:Uncharacterized protein n=1 Tax=Colwellia psychrerythraea (strain 34H / ATCC BAA-681) TaxID=167879 RepID=Q481G6_COLP3|nr:hypothetical protein CPS_2588 [Colwellia psychrerythraea 34H]
MTLTFFSPFLRLKFMLLTLAFKVNIRRTIY